MRSLFIVREVEREKIDKYDGIILTELSEKSRIWTGICLRLWSNKTRHNLHVTVEYVCN